MPLPRKVPLLVGALAATVLVTLVALPLVYKDRIAELARAEAENILDARVSWSRAGLTLLRSFPTLTLRLDDLSVVGAGRFAGDTLASMEELSVALDVMSAVRSLRGTAPVAVRGVTLRAPVMNLRVLEDGTANWDIVRPRPDEPSTEGAPRPGLEIELRGLRITDGRVVLDDAPKGLFLSMTGLRHELDGDFSAQRFVLSTHTTVDTTTLRFAGMPYLDGVALDFRAELDADLVSRTFTFADNELRLNDLALEFSGAASQAGDDVALDVTFQAPRTDFGQILSLVPVLYTRDFEALQTTGTLSVEGHVRGELGEASFPTFALDAVVADGTFRYPDLALPARDVAFHLSLSNPGGDVDSTVVRLERFHVRIGDAPVDGSLTLRTPVSDPDVDLSVRGALDLGDLVRTVKLDDVEELSGVVRVDAAVRARRSDVDSARYERVVARGSIDADDVRVRAVALAHPVTVHEVRLELAPERVAVRALRMEAGATDVDATGSVDNALGFLLRGEDMRGTASFHSRFVDLDEWRSDDALELIPVPAGVDLRLDGTVERLVVSSLPASDARGSVGVKDRRLTLDDFEMRTLGGRIALSGFYETTDPSRPTFGVGLTLDSLDIPAASQALLTVRTLAPVSRFARGAFTARLDLSGALGEGMSPVFDALTGTGSLATTPVAIEGFSALVRLAETLSLPELASPTFNAIRSTVDIRDGRLHVRPFQVRAAGLRMGVAGSNGVDQTLDYDLLLSVPRSLLGAGADRAVRGLIARAGSVGVELEAADTINISVGLGGTVTSPTIQTDFGGVVSSAARATRQLVEDAVDERVQNVRQRADSASAEAERRLRSRADSVMQQAEVAAAAVRAEARRLADAARAEATRRADQVVAEARNPIERAAARVAANRIMAEAETRASAIVEQADGRADELVAAARERADAILRGG